MNYRTGTIIAYTGLVATIASSLAMIAGLTSDAYFTKKLRTNEEEELRIYQMNPMHNTQSLARENSVISAQRDIAHAIGVYGFGFMFLGATVAIVGDVLRGEDPRTLRFHTSE